MKPALKATLVLLSICIGLVCVTALLTRNPWKIGMMLMIVVGVCAHATLMNWKD